MVITYYGLSCFKLQSGELTLAIDPFGKESGLTPPRFQTDVIISSHDHPNHNNIETLHAKGDGKIFSITGPGEYEIHSIRVRAVASFHDRERGARKGKNIVSIIHWEDMTLAHLGDYGEDTLRDDLHEAIGTPDILFIPVGGGDTIDAEHAAKFVQQIEPRVVIPMHYKISGCKAKIDEIDIFLKEMGEKCVPEDKFTIKKSGLPSDSQKIVVLNALAAV